MRWSSFFGSLGLHSLVIGLVMLLSLRERAIEKAIYFDPGPEPERKVLYYDVRYKLPEVTSSTQVSTAPRPQGREVSDRTVVAASPKPSSDQQIIVAPAPEISNDAPVPDLSARLGVDLPPPPPKPVPRVVRQFIPPPAAQPQTRTEISATDLPVTTPSSHLPDTSNSTISTGLAAIPTSPPPAPKVAPPATTLNPGNSTADVTVANLRNESTKTEVPVGARPGQFSKAPTQGSADGGPSSPGAARVPDLTVQANKNKVEQTPASETRRKPILYTERVRSASLSTFSVPLRPSSRMIPRAVDARFAGRSVYTMVIPIENLQSYSGDWIIWFAEREPMTGERPVVRAPVPFRKMELPDPVDSASPAQRVQVAAVIEKGGKLNPALVMTSLTPAVQQAVLQDLKSWEFQPATRNGVPIDIEIVIEFSFRAPLLVSQR